MNPPLYCDIFPRNHDFSFVASIGKAPKTYNDIKFCKEPKTIIVVDKWLNSLKKYNFHGMERWYKRLFMRLKLTICLTGVVLKVFHVLDGHLYDLRLLDPAPALLRVRVRDQSTQVGWNKDNIMLILYSFAYQSYL